MTPERLSALIAWCGCALMVGGVALLWSGPAAMIVAGLFLVLISFLEDLSRRRR